MKTPYDDQDLPDLEVIRLRTEVAELKSKLERAYKILEENGLEEAKPKEVSEAELICHAQINIFKQLSDKGFPFSNEDTKNFETFVKALLAIQGKSAPAQESKPKKKQESVKVADLLSIAKNPPKAKE